MIFNQLEEFGTLLDTRQNEEMEIKALSFKYLGLYFTADWCGACVKLVRSLPPLINRVNQGSDLFKLITFRLD
jgi:hypothetical protein